MFAKGRKSRYLRFAAIFTAVIMVTLISGACQKSDTGGTQASGSAAKSASASAAKTTVKATTAAATAAAKTTAAAATASIAESTNENALVTTGPEETQEPVSEIGEELAEIEFSEGSALGNVIDIDLGGRTITHINTAETNIWGDDDTKRMEYRALYKRILVAQKKYNFKLEQSVMPSAQYLTTVVSNTLAGIKTADILIFGANQLFPSLINQGIVAPMSDYIDYELPVVKANKYLYTGSYWKGKHYGYTPIYEYGYANTIYNRDIIAREGLPDILDFVETNQWNWEAFLDVTIKCTKDSNGDGITDQWGVGSAGAVSFVKYLLYSNGIIFVDTYNEPHTFNLNNGPAYRGLQFAVDLCNVYKVVNYNDTWNGTKLFSKGLTAIDLYNYQINNSLLTAGLNSGLAPLPMGPDVSIYQNIDVPTIYHVSSLCENPKEVTQIITEAMTLWDENLNPIPEYQAVRDIYGYDYNWSSKNVVRRITTERENRLSYEQLYPLFRADLSGGYPNMSNVVNAMLTKLLTGEISVAQGVSSIEIQVEDIIKQN